MIRAVLFDLDGTLVDSIPDLNEATSRMLAELGEAPRSQQEIMSFVGRGIAHLVECALTAGRDPKSTAEIDHAQVVFKRHYVQVNGNFSKVYPGIANTLAELKNRGMLMACITNKSSAFTEPLLSKMALAQYFDCVISGDSLPQKKPAPEPVLRACALLGVLPEQAIMVGDSINDAQAAHAAGVRVLLVTWGYSEGQPVDTIKCDGLVSSFAELLGFVEPGANKFGNTVR